MKKKLVSFFIWFLFIKFIGSQEIEKEKNKEEYIPSFTRNQEILRNSLKSDFENKIKIALELKEINAKISIQRIYEIIFHYKGFLKDQQKLELLLDTLSELSKNNKEYEYWMNFEEILLDLEKEGILREPLKSKYISNKEGKSNP
ncbi:MAG: hypothetical protein ACK4UJ_10255 [Leptonema sp. (in: bacteria)]